MLLHLKISIYSRQNAIAATRMVVKGPMAFNMWPAWKTKQSSELPLIARQNSDPPKRKETRVNFD